MVRSDKASAAAAHPAIDAKVNYFRWMPWDMSVVAAGDQYDLAAEVWVLTGPNVGPAWHAMAQGLFEGRRVRFFSEGPAEGVDNVAGAAFDVMSFVFSQKMLPEIVISLTDDSGFAPMRAWFTRQWSRDQGVCALYRGLPYAFSGGGARPSPAVGFSKAARQVDAGGDRRLGLGGFGLAQIDRNHHDLGCRRSGDLRLRCACDRLAATGRHVKQRKSVNDGHRAAHGKDGTEWITSGA